MTHWVVTDKNGDHQFVETPSGKTPHDHGYPEGDFTFEKLSRRPKHDEQYVEKKLRRMEKVATEMELLIDARLRHHGLIP